MKKWSLLMLFAIAASAIKAQPCTELFFSEYIEGTSNNKALEIFNPTSAPISLTGYKVQLYSNGATTANSTLNLAGTIAPNGVYVIVNSQAAAYIKAARDTTANGITSFNGNDAVALVKGTSNLDIIGIIGDTTIPNGSGWIFPGTGGLSTANQTIVRKGQVHEGTTSWALSSSQWAVLPVDTSFLGVHTTGSCPSQADTSINFSPTSNTVAENAGTYTITLSLNQPAASDKTVDIKLASGDTADIGGYITQSVTIPANAISQSLTIDITNDTLPESAEQLVFQLFNPSSGLLIDADSLFTLTITDDDTPLDTIVAFSTATATARENAGAVTLSITLNQRAASDKIIDIELVSGDAGDIGNYTTQSLTIPANTFTQTLAINITNDTLIESDEQYVMRLVNPSSGLVIGSDSLFTLTITDDDTPLPYYPIAAVTTVDASGVLDSNNVRCMVSGVVYGINQRSSGLQFTINDRTGGIGVFSATSDFGYTVNEGDSVMVAGEVTQFNGYAQMAADTVYAVGSGTLLQPALTAVLNESTESELVRINQVWLVNTSQWDNSNTSGFSVDVTNGSQTYSMRIDEQVDLFNQSAPTSSFDVIGLGRQFDSSSPFDDGYQISPRYSADLILRVGIFNNDSQGGIKVYPNPGTGIFNVQLNAALNENALIEVADVAGRVVYRMEKAMVNGNTLQIDLKDAPTGIYFLEVSSESVLSRTKIYIR